MTALVLALRIIVIDPGHGGSDPGGVGTGLEEKDVVLDTCKRFRDLLKADDGDPAGGGEWTVHMTRDTDVYVGLTARSDYANSLGADRFMSIHSNAFSDPSANGTETFSYSEGTTGAELRNVVQEEMLAAWMRRDRGVKTANFAVLRETSMPAELHELSFITNTDDAAFLADPAQRQIAAEAHLRAIQRHFGIAPYIPGAEPAPGSIAGVVSDDDGPVAGAHLVLDGNAQATSGDDGAYTFDLVPRGPHTVEATAAGHVPNDVDVTVDSGAEATADIHLDVIQTEPPGPDGGVEMPGDEGGCAISGRRPPPAPWLALASLLLLCGIARRRR